jgi:hypothetical protein
MITIDSIKTPLSDPQLPNINEKEADDCKYAFSKSALNLLYFTTFCKDKQAFAIYKTEIVFSTTPRKKFCYW